MFVQKRFLIDSSDKQAVEETVGCCIASLRWLVGDGYSAHKSRQLKQPAVLNHTRKVTPLSS